MKLSIYEIEDLGFVKDEKGYWNYTGQEMFFIFDENMVSDGKLKLKFGEINGTIDLSNLGITTLENCPIKCSAFICNYNNIYVLKNIPIAKTYHLNHNNITRIDVKFPKKVSTLSLHHNKLTSLENLPEKINVLKINDNYIKSFSSNIVSVNESDFKNNQISSFENVFKHKSINVQNNDIKDLTFSLETNSLSLIDNKNLTSLKGMKKVDNLLGLFFTNLNNLEGINCGKKCSLYVSQLRSLKGIEELEELEAINVLNSDVDIKYLKNVKINEIFFKNNNHHLIFDDLNCSVLKLEKCNNIDLYSLHNFISKNKCKVVLEYNILSDDYNSQYYFVDSFLNYIKNKEIDRKSFYLEMFDYYTEKYKHLHTDIIEKINWDFNIKELDDLIGNLVRSKRNVNKYSL